MTAAIAFADAAVAAVPVPNRIAALARASIDPLARTSAKVYRRVYQAANYRLRSVAGGRFRSACRPVSIALLLTERCNARCVHCNIWQNKGKEDSPRLEEWKTCLSDLAHWLGPVQVTLTGGEALMQPFTPALVAHGVSRGLAIELLTHGYWSDPTRLEQAALADPWRITMSLDGIGETHSIVRGRPNFWEKSLASLRMLHKLRAERGLHYIIRLKTVLMSQNIQSAAEVARFAADNDMEVFYQPIDKNYNSGADDRWFESAPTWPKDPEVAAATVNELIRLKRQGYPIANSFAQLEAMIPYFRDPMSLQAAVQGQAAHESVPNCSALTTLQIQANGDVGACHSKPPFGNIKHGSIPQIWADRPRFWEQGCCQAGGAAAEG
jgi:MoaA/NifB/PqqE/SkfB family radical SAM enzyme